MVLMDLHLHLQAAEAAAADAADSPEGRDQGQLTLSTPLLTQAVSSTQQSQF